MDAYFCAWLTQDYRADGRMGPPSFHNEFLVGSDPFEELANYGNCTETRWVLLSWKQVTIDEERIPHYEQSGVMVTRRDLE